MLAQEGPGIPVPQIPMPTTMLARLPVEPGVPLRLVIVALPFAVLPAKLKVSGAPDCGTVGVADSLICVAVHVGHDATVVAGEVGIPLLVLVTTIPATTQVLLVLLTELTVVLLVVQEVPVFVHVVGSVYWVLVFPLVGPTASELAVKVRFGADEIVIDELLTLLTVAPLGMPCPYICIPA